MDRRRTASATVALFGQAAWLVPLVVAIFGAIVFLEINVPRMIATLGIASLAYLLIVDAAEDKNGGIVGASLAHALRVLFGSTGEAIVRALLAVVVFVWITNVSVKRTIGRGIAAANGLREQTAKVTAALGKRSGSPTGPAPCVKRCTCLPRAAPGMLCNPPITTAGSASSPIDSSRWTRFAIDRETSRRSPPTSCRSPGEAVHRVDVDAGDHRGLVPVGGRASAVRSR